MLTCLQWKLNTGTIWLSFLMHRLLLAYKVLPMCVQKNKQIYKLTHTCFVKGQLSKPGACPVGFVAGAVEKGSKGAVAPMKKLWGLTKIICSCDGEPSSIASIIQDTLIEQSRSRYSNKQSQYSQYSKLHVYSYKEGDIV